MVLMTLVLMTLPTQSPAGRLGRLGLVLLALRCRLLSMWQTLLLLLSLQQL